MTKCKCVAVFSGQRGASHHPAHVPVLQKDDGIFLPGEECGGGGSC